MIPLCPLNLLASLPPDNLHEHQLLLVHDLSMYLIEIILIATLWHRGSQEVALAHCLKSQPLQLLLLSIHLMEEAS